MIRDGELPSGDICPYSGQRAGDVIFFDVQCERMWVRGGDAMDARKAFVIGLLFGWIWGLLASRKPRPRTELGRDTYIVVPVSISSGVRPKLLRNRGQGKLKTLLRQTPIYAELLREFPDARVTIQKVD